MTSDHARGVCAFLTHVAVKLMSWLQLLLLVSSHCHSSRRSMACTLITHNAEHPADATNSQWHTAYRFSSTCNRIDRSGGSVIESLAKRPFYIIVLPCLDSHRLQQQQQRCLSNHMHC